MVISDFDDIKQYVKSCLPGAIRDFVIVDDRGDSILLLTDPRKDPRSTRLRRSFFCQLYKGITSPGRVMNAVIEHEALLVGFGLIVKAQSQTRFPTLMVADTIDGVPIWVDPHIKNDRAKTIAAGHFSVGIRGNQLIEVRLNPVN